MKTPIAWYRVIRKAEDLLSASQNQQNEKESDAVEFALWLIDSDYSRISFNQWIELGNINEPFKTTEELYELFKQSKTNLKNDLPQK